MPSITEGFRIWATVTLGTLIAAASGCSDDEPPPATTGGTAGTAGSAGTGGASGGGTNGASGTGGASGSGGSSDAGSDASVPAPEVTTDKGKVRGKVVDGINARTWAFRTLRRRGARIAGNRRNLRPPGRQRSKPRHSARSARRSPRDRPPTTRTATKTACRSTSGRRICHASSPMPVMVWIHGGAFVFGSGGRLLRRHAAGANLWHGVVTLNYRLGASDILAHPRFPREVSPSFVGRLRHPGSDSRRSNG